MRRIRDRNHRVPDSLLTVSELSDIASGKLETGMKEEMDNQEFTVKYKYGKDVASETLGAWWRRKFRVPVLLLAAGAVVCAILALVLQQPVWLFPAVVCVLGDLAFWIQGKRAVTAEMDALRRLYHIDNPSITAVIGEKIQVKVSNHTKTHAWSEIEGYLETKNQFILLLHGSRTIALPKNGFGKQSPDACRQYLEERLKRR